MFYFFLVIIMTCFFCAVVHKDFSSLVHGFQISSYFLAFYLLINFFSCAADYEAVVKLSDGFNGADLRNVCTEAGSAFKK